MPEMMTIDEIESRFQSEWVLLSDPQTDETLQVLGGTVLHHSKDRDEVYRRMVALRPQRSAVLYTGGMPEGTELVL
ncbi:MAG: hypothetical protein JXB10_08230 [Pirellulales bacterium]|nr:hypothetical protein [Pirellulales bacterium]